MNIEQANQPIYDYVIVGSGAGGGPLAGNLAKAGQKVLLLEAGGDYEDYNYQVPAFHALASEDENLRWDYFVRHYADEEQQCRDTKLTRDRNGVLYPRSGTLGGCTAHHALITVYPHNSDWDQIAQLTGDPSWRSQQMRKYFERLERCQYIKRPCFLTGNAFLSTLIQFFPFLSKLFGNPSRHGFDGWLSTNVANPSLVITDGELLKVILSAAKEALVEHLGRPLTSLESLNGLFDPNDWRAQANGMQGLWFTPLSTNAGKRHGTREYIRAVQTKFPHNLTVKTNALVTKVLFDDDQTAIGVQYLDGAHLYRADPKAEQAITPTQTVQVLVKKEVILSAGTFSTPQLLKLSGIGPCKELEQFGIQVRVDLPGVGENLQDRYEVGVVSEMKTDFSLLKDLTFEPPHLGQAPDPSFVAWQSGKGLYTTNGVAIGIIKKSQEARPNPDLYIFGLPSNFHGYFPGYSKEAERNKNYFTWAILKAHTLNTAGRVTLRSSDPCDVPEINFHYFSEGNDAAEEDLESVADGVEFVRRIMRHADRVTKSELRPGKDVSTRAQIKGFIKDEAWGHHASCTCKMGAQDDAMAVVDSNFRVRGTKNLRVVDASVFPHIPGFFIITAIYMISEKASDVILADA
jgi:choline dehydrogenase-like flavoprotein